MSLADFFTNVALALLALDTVRAILAMLGWVPRQTKILGKIIYGNYDRQLITEGLKELGFTHQQSEEIKKDLKSSSDKTLNTNGITPQNAAQHLIALLAKYIVYFDTHIQYGGSGLTASRYYINTMEISHNNADKKKLVAIMSYLYASVNTDGRKPDIVATPKGGNPLFAIDFAQHYSSEFIMIKSKEDKSRIVSITEDPTRDFNINYEGSWGVKERAKKVHSQKCIILDCNTSGGSQLIHAIEELSEIASRCKDFHLEAPNAAFVLFRVDSGKTDIDQKFSDHACTLYRFFDLNEDIKKSIYELNKKATAEHREPDIYYRDDASQIDKIISMMKEKELFYYSPKEEE
ncbi:hypothetical protein [Flavonifractor sp. An306]|uniref:hypothetical protein n=1 Tax=Flavonifractor sp. An306 TaxID=1965629 RepID=UPI000B386237|nr:hypothetical protein [Flavonifractor sp. An306]OUO37943.1 hypothetical protein B5F88_12055 [Flavonifractor sp. An306]